MKRSKGSTLISILLTLFLWSFVYLLIFDFNKLDSIFRKGLIGPEELVAWFHGDEGAAPKVIVPIDLEKIAVENRQEGLRTLERARHALEQASQSN